MKSAECCISLQQAESYQVKIFPTHGVGQYSKPYLEVLYAEAFDLAKGKGLRGIFIKSLY